MRVISTERPRLLPRTPVATAATAATVVLSPRMVVLLPRMVVLLPRTVPRPWALLAATMVATVVATRLLVTLVPAATVAARPCTRRPVDAIFHFLVRHLAIIRRCQPPEGTRIRTQNHCLRYS